MLNLTRISGVTASTIKTIAAKLSELRELYLYADAGIENEGFAALGKGVVSKLNILDLCGCSKLEDQSLIDICTNNHDLRYLNLTWCLALTDRGVSDSIQHISPGLQLLSLFGNL